MFHTSLKTCFPRITRTKGHCLRRSAQRHYKISFKASFNLSLFLNWLLQLAKNHEMHFSYSPEEKNPSFLISKGTNCHTYHFSLTLVLSVLLKLLSSTEKDVSLLCCPIRKLRRTGWNNASATKERIMGVYVKVTSFLSACPFPRKTERLMIFLLRWWSIFKRAVCVVNIVLAKIFLNMDYWLVA